MGIHPLPLGWARSGEWGMLAFSRQCTSKSIENEDRYLGSKDDWKRNPAQTLQYLLRLGGEKNRIHRKPRWDDHSPFYRAPSGHATRSSKDIGRRVRKMVAYQKSSTREVLRYLNKPRQCSHHSIFSPLFPLQQSALIP
jgi:hypothetical protein